MQEGKTISNKKYTEESKCEGPECDRKPVCKGCCSAHYYQRKRGLALTPIGSTQGRKKVKGYSTTKKCDYCGLTKDWKAFVMGAEDNTRRDECRDCYRKRLLGTEEDKPKSKATMDDVLAFIDNASKK